jgi:hypothetical protein
MSDKLRPLRWRLCLPPNAARNADGEDGRAASLSAGQLGISTVCPDVARHYFTGDDLQFQANCTDEA